MATNRPVQESQPEEVIYSRDGTKKAKIFNDPVHGTIEVNPVCMAIIDTPEFQRLRYIKQLGGCYHVYPGATHNRFEHSIGVYHLAGKFVRILKEHQPDLPIDQKDILCVEIAALCHDLGHGPFSHVFEKLFAKRVDSQSKWKHEETSIDMVHHIMKHDQVRKAFKDNGINDQDVLFITEMINPPKPCRKDDYVFKGRKQQEGKQFLYEIVSNYRNSIDVDKWDYFARDSLMLGMKNNFDHFRYMNMARVIDIKMEDAKNDELYGRQICMKNTEAQNIYSMFQTRESLHRRAYQHKDTKGVELMLAEAFYKMNDHINELGMFRDNPPRSLYECTENMEHYALLTDSLFHQIMFSSSEDRNVKEAKRIMEMIQARNFYKCVARCNVNVDVKPIEKNMEREIKEAMMAKKTDLDNIHGDQLIVTILGFDYGMRKVEEDPVEHVRFYKKDNLDTGMTLTKTRVSHSLPRKFHQETVAVYCKDRNDKKLCQATIKLFTEWCNTSNKPHMDNPPEILA